jgi:SAM-dependent methyltransferase
MKDFLYLHTRDLPYFRGLLRAVESQYYQDLDLPTPTLDVGCGDGHFTQLTFDRKLEMGIDPWWPPIREAGARDVYHLLTLADGGKMPYPNASFASAISNSVLEHIPHVELVLAETARVLKPGAIFVLCVPNHQFNSNLSIARGLDRAGLKSLAESYRRFFTRISRHIHLDNPEIWTARLKKAGFTVERHWNYFPPASLAVLEWGHYFGLPSLVTRKLFGRWILVRARWNLALTMHFIRPYYVTSPCDNGAYTFYITRRLE